MTRVLFCIGLLGLLPCCGGGSDDDDGLPGSATNTSTAGNTVTTGAVVTDSGGDCPGPALCNGNDIVDGSEPLFDTSVVHDFSLEIPPESWDAINDQAIPPDCVSYKRDYHTGSLSFQGEVYAGVGLHIKGGCGSSRDLSEKAAFKVNLSWDDPAIAGCGEERKIFGQKKLSFNNSVQDESHTHEMLAYRFFRAAGVPAPRVTHVRLAVNGEYWGIYNLVESIERSFLDRWFPDNKGMMWEAAYWCDIIPENVPNALGQTSCMDLEFTIDECDDPLAPDRDPQDWSLLSLLAQGLTGPRTGTVTQHLSQYFDLDHLYSFWAVERILGHWDGYFGEIVSNYRVYHHPADGLYYLIPWGTDQTFNQNVGVFDVNNVIAEQCLDDAECRAGFEAKLESLITVFQSLGLSSELSALETKLGPLVSSAPRGQVSSNELSRAISQTNQFVQDRPDEVLSDLAGGGGGF